MTTPSSGNRFLILCLCTLAHSASAQDLYEPDDTSATARILPVSGIGSQQHNFHVAGDEDWFRFYAVEDQFYEISVYDTGSNTDATIGVYEPDGTTLVFPVVDDALAGENELTSWRATASGIFYIRISNYDPDTFGNNTDYKIVLYRPQAPDTGVIEGIVTSNQELTEVAGTVLTTDTGASAIVGDDGSFEMEVESGNVSVTSLRNGVSSVLAQLTVTKDQTSQLDAVLEADSGEETLQNISSTSKNGPDVRLTMGATLVDDDTFANAFSKNDEVMITATVYPAAKDVGKRALVFVVIGSLTADGLQFHYLDSNNEQQLWDLDFAHLKPARDISSLTDSEKLTVFTGNLAQGKYRIFVGYSLVGGAFQYNLKGYKLSITN